ncbi:hypothetical protein CTI12_AA217700 [Artemisia annua]|uniref:Uncharacterized protein n=1 Tax=Artemisia annua TaxID=35608 RepID=A0A2U1N7U0_ARTAN|nr:hypothetical protein CTI12_AA217700 [Artemisia annua]
MSTIDTGTNMIGCSSNTLQTGIPQQAITVSSLTPENSTALTTQIRTIVDTPTINPNYPSHPSQPIMCIINSGSNLSGGSSYMAHIENSLIPSKPITMPVRSGETSATPKLISDSVAQISQYTHAYQNQPLLQHAFTNKAVQQPPTYSSANQSNNTLSEQKNQPYRHNPKDQPSHCSRSIPNRQMVVHNSQASKQNSQQSSKQIPGQIQQGTGSRQQRNNDNSLSASVDIKTPNEFPTRDAWREYALRKVRKLKEEYFKELLDIHQSTIESRIKAHIENSLIPSKPITMPVSSGETSATPKLISDSVAQISQYTHAYQNQPLLQHAFTNKAVQQPPTYSSANQSNNTEQKNQPYQYNPKDQPSHCSRSIPNRQMVVHNSQASKQNSQQSSKQIPGQIQQGTGSRQRGNNDNSLSASVDIKTPNEFPTRDAWRDYALRKVHKLKEEYFKELLDIHQSTIESRIKVQLNDNKFQKQRQTPAISTSINASKRSQVPPKLSQSVGPSSRRPTQPETRNSSSLNDGSRQKRPMNPVLVGSSKTRNSSSPKSSQSVGPSSASPVETQKLKTPIQETPNSKDPILHLVDVVKSVSSKSMVSALKDISCVQKVMDIIPDCPPSDSASLLLQYENEPQRKIRRTLNVSLYHDKIFSDEWDIDFLETTMNMKPSVGNKGLILDEIRETNFELLETSLVVVLDTADDYVKILGSQGGTIVKCLYTNVCFPDLCGPQKMPDFVIELLVPVDYPNSSPKIFNAGRNVLSQPWKKLYEDILTRFDLSLPEIPGQISLGDMAREWDASARSVITKFVEGKGGNSFSSRYGSWESA